MTNRRGYYIYGKDFFILPNKLWKKVSENDRVVFNLIESNVKISIDKEYLIPTIRKPSECAYEIEPKFTHYVISIPDLPISSLPPEIGTYIQHTQKLLGNKKIPAISLYKGTRKRWYSHIWYSLKEPFGAIVIPEKFRPYKRGVSAHYVGTKRERFAVPVTFYTRSTGSPLKDYAIVAWLNSTIGLAFRYVDRAWLGTASERMSGEQLDAMKILNVAKCSSSDLSRLVNTLLKLPSPLPEFEEQLKEPFYSESGRLQLDNAILELLGVKESKIDFYRQHCINKVKTWIRTIKAIQ